MRKRFTERLHEGRPLVSDGAMGTMLQAKGLESGACPELWNVENPEAVLSIHRAYREAGCDILQTNTFGGSRIKLAKYGLEGRMAELNRAGAALARQIAGEDLYVAASMGPTGEFIEPLGDLSFDAAVEIFREQALALAEGGADVLLFETFSDLQELQAGIEGASATGLPVMCTMAFDTGGKTMMGVSPADFAWMLAPRVAAVGANCGGGPEEMLPIVTEMMSTTESALIAQPNAGIPQLVEGRTVFPATPATMAVYAERFARLGVRIIVGCCGTTPEHLRAIAQAGKKYPKPIVALSTPR